MSPGHKLRGAVPFLLLLACIIMRCSHAFKHILPRPSTTVPRTRRAVTLSVSEGLNKGRVLVAGATGRTGKRIVDVLKEKGVPVTAGVRDVDKAEKIWGSPSETLSYTKLDVCGDEKDTLVRIINDGGYSAVVCATGFVPSFPPDLLGPWRVDYQGTIRLIEATRDAKVPKFVMVSSLLTNGLEAGQALNRQYLLLNAFGGILVAKNLAERYLMRQSPAVDWTIVRPGGLKEADPSPNSNIVFSPADTLFNGSISRRQVAEVVAESIFRRSASNKVVEIISSQTAPAKSMDEGFLSC